MYRYVDSVRFYLAILDKRGSLETLRQSSFKHSKEQIRNGVIRFVVLFLE